MAVTKIKIWFMSLDVLDDADSWGAGEWHLHATVDGVGVGNSGTEFTARAGMPIPLPAATWSRVVPVHAKVPGDTVQIRLHVIEKGTFSDDNLGEVRAILNHPFRTTHDDLQLESPDRHYRLHIRVTIEEEVATTTLTGPTRVPVTRTAAGGVTFNAVKGAAFTPRVEVCPVIPNPAAPAHMPPRLVLPAALAAGVTEAVASVAAAPSAPALNALVNPSVIPIIAAGDPNLATRIARLSATYIEPGNLDASKFFWRVVSGPAVIHGSNMGKTVQVRGTGNAADTMATFEVRWENAAGPVLVTYRAWVGKVGTLPYRLTLLNGSAAALNVAALMPSATVNSIMQIVQAIYYQAGIRLIPDPTATGYEGATLFPAGNANAIFQFQVAATNNWHTQNVNHNVVSRATRYNFRPGVINFVIVHSTASGTAAAVDRNGIAGVAAGIQLKYSKKYKINIRHYKNAGKGSTKKLGGSPSASWIKPSGIPKDGPGVMKTLKTIHPTDRVKQAGPMDKWFVNARKKVVVPPAPAFTAASMGQLYACQIPATWGLGQVAAGTWTAAQYQWNCAVNFAHELGHVLGLAHRGSGWSPTAPLSADGMDCKNQTGVMKGHPWHENIMSYGYAMLVPRAHDIDLIQVSVIRTHPAITYPP